MSFDTLKLDKGLYTSSKGFTAALEEADPSENYIGTELEGLDAYQRQLKRFDIKVSGRNSDCIAKFFQTTDSAALFPEYVSRAVMQGIETEDNLSKIIATTTNIDSLDYRSIASVQNDNDFELAAVGEGAFIPQTVIKTSENLTRLHKRGRMLVASYEAIKFQKLDLFTITLNQIGSYIARSQFTDAVNTLGEAFGKMTDTENPVVTYYAYNTENCNLETVKGEYVIDSVSSDAYITYSVDVMGRQTLYFDGYDGFSNNLVEDINQSFEVYVNSSVKSYSYPTQMENGLLKLGSFENESVDITIKVLKEVSCSSFGVFGVKEDLVENAVQNTETLNLTQKGEVLTGNASKGNYFLSVPYSEDLKLTLDGEKLEFSKALSGFVSLEIPHDGVLRISLVPKGLVLGIIISVLGIISFLLMIFLGKKEISMGEKSVNIVYGIFSGIFALTVVLVYVIPIIVSLSDFKI